MDQMKSDLITAEKESSQYKLTFLKQKEKEEKENGNDEDDHYKKNEKEISK